jgi:hypothetical protein
MRRISLLAFTVLAVASAGAALAWACTPQAYIDVSPTTANPGDSVTVTGRGFIDGPVSISLNGTGVGNASGPSFSTTVTIPADAQPGIQYVAATANQWTANRSIRIAGAEAAPEGSEPGAAAQGAPAAQRQATRAPAKARQPATQPARERAAKQPAPAQRGAAATPSPAAPAPTGAPASDNPAVVATDSGTEVFGPSLAPKPAAVAARDAKARQPKAVSERSATASLQSALGSGNRLLAPTTNAAAAPGTGAGAGLAVGLGLLGSGLALLFGGFLVASVRRRRAVAGRQR